MEENHRAFLPFILSIIYYSSEEDTAVGGAVAEYRREKQKYEALRKQQPKKGPSREDQVISQPKFICNLLAFSCLQVLLLEPNLIIRQGKHYPLAMKKHVFIGWGGKDMATRAEVQMIEFFPDIVEEKPQTARF